jgi:PAS domain S-box-containing protein
MAWPDRGTLASARWLCRGGGGFTVRDDQVATHPFDLESDRLNRLYSALGQINQAIVRMPTRDRLFQKVCEILVEHAQFRMAWIGWHDPETRMLVPVARSGDENGYPQSIDIQTDDQVEGRGPSGIAFREDRSYVCNDILDDPATRPWRAELERRGFRASAAFPIRLHGVVHATLNVYSDHAGFFRDKEIATLTETAVDISFALDSLAFKAERQRAEESVRREQRFADSLIETMPGILYLYNEQGRFLLWNQNFENVSGYDAQEIASMNPLDFFTREDKPLLEQRIAEVFEKGEASVEASFMAKNGSTVPYYFTGKRISFEGTPCLVGMGIDITERKRAEAALSSSEKRYRTTLDGILEGCQLIGFDWRYLYLNQAAAVHNRRPNAELLGQRMPDAWPGIEASNVFALLRCCMEERVPRHEETEFVFPDGEKSWFDVRAQPVPEGIFVLSIDISERKRAETALRELNDGLELKIAERTADLAAARTRAESADQIKSAFLATMSHELRTPLNSILGFTGIILQQLAGPLTPEQSKQLGMVQSSARHLLELINDVLDISKIEADQLEVRFAPFDLRASIERVAASVKPLAERKRLDLNLILPPMLEIESDRRRVEQILLNLLNNALKFTDRGAVTLLAEVAACGASATGEPRSSIRIEVTDTGIGMKHEDLAKLFQPFQQIDSGLGRQHEGTGLGLAICSRLTRLLGGTIAATSTTGNGSVFTVVLPSLPLDVTS